MGYINRSVKLLEIATLADAQTVVGDEVLLPNRVRAIGLQANFVRAGGGTTCKVYLQTSLDGGTTWFDIACFAFATTSLRKLSSIKHDIATTPNSTASDAALTDNTVLDGIIGDRIRIKAAVVGTYTGASSLSVSACIN